MITALAVLVAVACGFVFGGSYEFLRRGGSYDLRTKLINAEVELSKLRLEKSMRAWGGQK